jgi:hypothetical protein
MKCLNLNIADDGSGDVVEDSNTLIEQFISNNMQIYKWLRLHIGHL